MIRRLAADWLLAEVALVGVAEGLAQTASSAAPAGVNEAAARAILAKDAIRLYLPLSAPRKQHEVLEFERARASLLASKTICDWPAAEKVMPPGTSISLQG